MFLMQLLNRLFGDEADLQAFNIQRGRDHGMGSYNNIRYVWLLSLSYDT